MPLSNSSIGLVDTNYVSSVGNLIKHDGLAFGKVFYRYNEKDFYTFLEENEAWMVSPDENIKWHEMGYLTNTAVISSVSGGASGGATATLTLDSSDHYQSGTRSPINRSAMVEVKGTKMYVQSKDTSTPNAHTITVEPVGPDSNTQLNNVLNSGDTITITGNQYAEHTRYDVDHSRMPDLFQEKMGIVKNKIPITGTQATNKNRVADRNGNMYQVYQEDVDVFERHKLQCNYMVIIGPGGTATDSNGNTVPLIKGAVQQIRERGNEYGYNGGLTMTDIDNWTRMLKKEQAPVENIMNQGHEAYINLENVVDDKMKDGARVYLDNTAGGGAVGNTLRSKKRMIDFGFDGFFKAGFCFYNKSFSAFDHPQITYAAGQPYPSYIMVTPMEYVKDPRSGVTQLTTRLAYKKVSGPQGTEFDMKFKSNIGGDRAPYPDDDLDEVNFRYVTYLGIVQVNANQGIIAYDTTY